MQGVAGGGGQKLAKFCGRPIWMAPYRIIMVFVVVAHASRAYVVKPGDGLEDLKRYFGLHRKDVHVKC